MSKSLLLRGFPGAEVVAAAVAPTAVVAAPAVPAPTERRRCGALAGERGWQRRELPLDAPTRSPYAGGHLFRGPPVPGMCFVYPPFVAATGAAAPFSKSCLYAFGVKALRGWGAGACVYTAGLQIGCVRRVVL